MNELHLTPKAGRLISYRARRSLLLAGLSFSALVAIAAPISLNHALHITPNHAWAASEGGEGNGDGGEGGGDSDHSDSNNGDHGDDNGDNGNDDGDNNDNNGDNNDDNGDNNDDNGDNQDGDETADVPPPAGQ